MSLRPSRRVVPLLLLPLLLAACGVQPSDPVQAGQKWFLAPVMAEAREALRSTAEVRVDSEQEITLSPATGSPRAGLILYPGASVDPRAYAPAARALAQRGHRVILASMPFGFSLFNGNAADDIIRRHPEIPAWAIGGHSLGGVAAASYAAEHSNKLKGLVFWASYPASGTDLKSSGLKVVSIWGTRDGRSKPAAIRDSARWLPADARFVSLEGGNHAQFGWYGAQAGDLEATLSREEQQRQIVEATAALLEAIAPAAPAGP
ncbi:Alpha/beta hydrolase family protein [compost metagenome]